MFVRLKSLKLTSQMYGRSPVCVRIWTVNAFFALQILWQYWHWYFTFSISYAMSPVSLGFSASSSSSNRSNGSVYKVDDCSSDFSAASSDSIDSMIAGNSLIISILWKNRRNKMVKAKPLTYSSYLHSLDVRWLCHIILRFVMLRNSFIDNVIIVHLVTGIFGHRRCTFRYIVIWLWCHSSLNFIQSFFCFRAQQFQLVGTFQQHRTTHTNKLRKTIVDARIWRQTRTIVQFIEQRNSTAVIVFSTKEVRHFRAGRCQTNATIWQ